jgi:hypothetical protein
VPKQFVCTWCGRHFGALHHLTFHSALVHGRVMVADDSGSYTLEVVIDELHKRVSGPQGARDGNNYAKEVMQG